MRDPLAWAAIIVILLAGTAGVLTQNQGSQPADEPTPTPAAAALPSPGNATIQQLPGVLQPTGKPEPILSPTQTIVVNGTHLTLDGFSLGPQPVPRDFQVRVNGHLTTTHQVSLIGNVTQVWFLPGAGSGDNVTVAHSPSSGNLDWVLPETPANVTTPLHRLPAPLVRSTTTANEATGLVYVIGGTAWWQNQPGAGHGGSGDWDGRPIRSFVSYAPATGQVTTLNATLPSALNDFGSFWDLRPESGCVDGCLYLLGGIPQAGIGDAVTPEIYRYDPALDVLTTMDTLLPDTEWEVVTAWGGDKAYIYLQHREEPALGNEIPGLGQLYSHDPLMDELQSIEAVLPVPVHGAAMQYIESGAMTCPGPCLSFVMRWVHGPGEVSGETEPASGNAIARAVVYDFTTESTRPMSTSFAASPASGHDFLLDGRIYMTRVSNCEPDCAGPWWSATYDPATDTLSELQQPFGGLGFGARDAMVDHLHFRIGGFDPASGDPLATIAVRLIV